MKKLLQQISFALLFVFLMCGTSFSANELFRSIASGNWNSTSTWEISINGGGTWIPATLTPDNTSGAITIQSPNNVTVTADVSADQLTINTGAEISVNSGVNLTLLDGSGDDLTLLTGSTISGTGNLISKGATKLKKLFTNLIENIDQANRS